MKEMGELLNGWIKNGSMVEWLNGYYNSQWLLIEMVKIKINSSNTLFSRMNKAIKII